MGEERMRSRPETDEKRTRNGCGPEHTADEDRTARRMRNGTNGGRETDRMAHEERNDLQPNGG
eukprot:11209185-Lingulodinium_polyedra.AAC.1